MSNLCCHDQAGCSGVDGDVSSHQTHVLKLFVHFSVFLVGQSLDGAGEDHSLFLSESQSNGISARGGYECRWNRIYDINKLIKLNSKLPLCYPRRLQSPLFQIKENALKTVVKATNLHSDGFVEDTHSAQTVLPAEVCADTSTDSLLSIHKIASRWKGSRIKGYSCKTSIMKTKWLSQNSIFLL